MSDQVNHPEHYQQGGVETIEMMRRIWGNSAMRVFCAMNAFKYRMRAGHKGDAEEDIRKAMWYEDYENKLKNQ